MIRLFNEAPKWWWEDASLPGALLVVWPALRLAEICYRYAIDQRNASFEKRLQAGELFRPDVPTISVGNISVGGSGKTPVAIWLAGLLHECGLKPAIIARGYGAAIGQLNDEMLLAAGKCPYAAVLANPNRAAAIAEATGQHRVQAVILDDAFQHRKVQRDLDIVLVDATRGFGNGHLLPAGPLREPAESLSRAGLILLSRVEQVPPIHLDALVRQIQSAAGRQLPIGRISFEPAGLTDVKLNAADRVEGPCGAFAGIGNFGSFLNTCKQHGLDVAARMSLIDHVRYDQVLCSRISRWAEASGVRCLVTTEKDAVKLSRIDWAWPVPIRVLGIRVAPDEATRVLVTNAIEAVLERRPDQLR